MRMIPLSLAGAALLALSGCGEPAGKSGAAASGSSLTSLIEEAPELTKLSAALDRTGLETVFDGKGSYTILAPNDAAFAALGDKAEALSQPEQNAALAAALRGHILAGTMARADIGKAIDASAEKQVKVRTLGSGTVTFKRQGDAIVVTGSDGSSAQLLDSEMVGANGSALVIDKVLAAL